MESFVDQKAASVLVVDSESFTRLAVSSMFKEEGILADELVSGDGANSLILEKLAKNEPIYRLIVLSHSLPEIDGPDIATRIHQYCEEAGVHSPQLVCVTSHSDADFDSIALKAGFSRIFIQPLTKDHINELIAHVL